MENRLNSMLHSQRLILRPLQEADLTPKYLGWLNDPKVNQYLETRFIDQTMESLYSYWKKNKNNPNSPWFAICLSPDMTHIGNIKLGPVNWNHQNSDISLFIGERGCWGKGYASEAIALLRDWAFTELDLQKLNAGIYSNNIASRRAFEKCGFALEATLCEERISSGVRVDLWRMGLPRRRWSSSK